jgi:hypothetical protein
MSVGLIATARSILIESNNYKVYVVSGLDDALEFFLSGAVCYGFLAWCGTLMGPSVAMVGRMQKES